MRGGSSGRGGCSGGSRTATEKVDGVGKIMDGLKGDLAADVETVLEKLEAECGAFGESTKPRQKLELQQLRVVSDVGVVFVKPIPLLLGVTHARGRKHKICRVRSPT